MRIRHYYIYAMAALALCSCRKTRITTDVSRDISFSVVSWDDNEKRSRALISSETDMRSDGFIVYAAHTPGNSFSETPVVDFDGSTVVGYDATANGWTYTPLRYWAPGSTYRFRACWPYASGMTLTENYTTSTVTLGGFVSVADPASQKDLMLSQAATHTTTSNFSGEHDFDPVALTFDHILCNVNVQVKLAETYANKTFELNKVELNNIKSRGTYTLTNSGTASGDAGTWTASGSVIRCSKTLDNPITLSTTASDNIWADGLLLIPQDLSTVTLTVNYTIIQAGEDDDEKSVTLRLPTNATYAWQPGKKIVYLVAVSRDDKITFTLPEVDNWNTSAPSGAILIK